MYTPIAKTWKLIVGAILTTALLWGVLTAGTANAQIPGTWMPAGGSGVVDRNPAHQEAHASGHTLAATGWTTDTHAMAGAVMVQGAHVGQDGATRIMAGRGMQYGMLAGRGSHGMSSVANPPAAGTMMAEAAESVHPDMDSDVDCGDCH